jgi:5-methylcytosine-specific restriction endonuclease McrA
VIGPVGFVVTCRICERRRAVEKRRQAICHECWPAHRRGVKRRSDRKNAERVLEAGRRWRTANPSRVREYQRQRDAKPERKAYHREFVRRQYRERRLNELAVRYAPRVAVAAAEVRRTWLALPPGPIIEDRTGPCCPVACVTARKFVAGFCLECDEPFVACLYRGDRFCSLVCGKRYDRRQRRERKIAAFVEPVFRRRIFERDRWRCQLCKRLVSKTAVVPHPRAPTIDHIVPLARDGEHSMANVQTAHFICNSRKRERAMDEQLRLVG